MPSGPETLGEAAVLTKHPCLLVTSAVKRVEMTRATVLHLFKHALLPHSETKLLSETVGFSRQSIQTGHSEMQVDSRAKVSRLG